MKENIYRSIYCGEVDASYVGKEVRLAGWVNSIRNLGGLLFITLRDETGIVQLISEDADKYINITRESTVTITGTVAKRSDDMINPNMKTGEIEIEIKDFEILGECLEDNDSTLSIKKGFEILCDDEIFNIRHFRPYTLNGSRYILIEFS